MIDNRQIGNTIARLRQSRNMTQQQLASALNVSHQAVSKWETGAALPDIETMLALTRLFGVTVEQLMNGEVPESRFEKEPAPANPFDTLGQFVGGVVNDIGSLFRSEPKPNKEAVEDGAEDAEIEDEKDIEEGAPANDGIDLAELLEMAPFMTKGAVAEMLEKVTRPISAEEIAKFAPYLECDALEKLIRENCTEINWNTLRRIAPFLKKEMVDSFARIAAESEKRLNEAPAIDLNAAFENVQKGLDSAVQNVIRFSDGVTRKITKAIDDTRRDMMSQQERLAELRKNAFTKAMEADRWDWIETHLGELTDHALRETIARRAIELGKEDWVFRNLGDFATPEAIDKVLESGDWGWLSEHAWNLPKEQQERIALCAMKAENWQWLSNHAEQLDLTDCVSNIAQNALKSGARMLAVQLAHYDMTTDQIEMLALTAVDMNDLEFLDMIADVTPQEVLCRCALRLAKADEWEDVHALADKLSVQSLEWVMQEAISKGNFDEVDWLDAKVQELMSASEE
ncbi:MAG: helix-turn-helix transcriptional regulator [Clostridiales bacterium]|nr:helix-turn-helix transcriptional regulator [Clostridiales bacterium]